MYKERDGSWLYVLCKWDSYPGWVHEDGFDKIQGLEKKDIHFCYEWTFPVEIKEKTTLVPLGARLYDFDGMSFRYGRKKIPFHGLVMQAGVNEFSEEKLIKIARKYLNVPYLWGGRSPFGIDCSGFVQLVYSFFNIALPRDSKDQVKCGRSIDFVELSEVGDLAFFSENPGEAKITHVGIVLADFKIIHASGKVRVDSLDHGGIFRKKGGYSHYLRYIRRVLPD